MQKMFVVVRSDLQPGAQAAQACHAAIALAQARATDVTSWYLHSNNLVLLQVPDAQHLEKVLQKLNSASVEVAEFREPDFGGELTAAATVNPAAGKLLSQLPLALKGPAAE